MKKKNIYFIYDNDLGYYIKQGKYSNDRTKAKRYKTFKAIFKLYNNLKDTLPENSIIIVYEVFKTRKVGRVVHEKTDFMGEYSLKEYYMKEKEKAEIENHKVILTSTLNKEVNTSLSTEDAFWTNQ